MKEAMRLHPGVGFPLERVVPDDGLAIGDVHLPRGTIVGMNAWVIHHDKSIYGNDADDFKPERWLIADPARLRLMEKCFLSVRTLCPDLFASVVPLNHLANVIIGTVWSWHENLYWYALIPN